ncbi:MAG: PrsW family glutamic-type intramembrane protease [Nitrospinota bacterium]
MIGEIETLRLLYIALGPGIALSIFIYYSDRWDREPKQLAIKCFFLGGLAVFPSYYFEGIAETTIGINDFTDKLDPFYWPKIIFYAFFGVALAEEACKFLFLKAFVVDDKEFNEPFDGIIFGGLVGCGFATVENILYVLPQGQEVGIARMVTAIPGHAFFGIIMGYFLGRAKFSINRVKHLTKGLAVVVTLHGIYDTAAFANKSWSFILMFGIIFLGIYLGLKAKRELEKLGTVIEFSEKQYFPTKGPQKKVPLHLKDIRCLLSQGKLLPEDSLIDKKTGKAKSIREIFSSKIISQYKNIPKIPFCGLPVKFFLIFYQVTFGFYLYFWFLGNYRDFSSYKNLKLNPELLALGLFIFTVLPYYFYGIVQNYIEANGFSREINVCFNLAIAGIESTFLYFQFKMFSRFLKNNMDKPFPLLPVIFSFFIFSGLKKVLPLSIPFYILWKMGLTFFQGGVLAFVQRDLNLYWRLENEKKQSTYCY